MHLILSLTANKDFNTRINAFYENQYYTIPSQQAVALPHRNDKLNSPLYEFIEFESHEFNAPPIHSCPPGTQYTCDIPMHTT